MIAKLREFGGWPIYKVKLGNLTISRSFERCVSTPTRHSASMPIADGPGRRSRAFHGVRKLNVSSSNSRFARRLGWDGQGLQPIGNPGDADESCRIESDVDRCVGFFHGINIKLVKCGGMTRRGG